MKDETSLPPPPPPPPRRTRGFRILRFLVGTLALLVGLWGGGFVWFAATLPRHVADVTSRTDAIVVLTGGSARLSTGIALLQGGLSRKLFISGVHPGVEINEIWRLAGPPSPSFPSPSSPSPSSSPELLDPGAAPVSFPPLTDAIVLGYNAGDTIGNATETAQWIAEHRLGSLRLVTAAYHMPRSLLEFHHAMPEATIIPHPVFPLSVKSREWWRRPGTALLLAGEYTKYLAAIVRHGFSSSPDLSPSSERPLL